MLACAGIRSPMTLSTAGAMPSITRPGRIPAKTHRMMRIAIAPRDQRSTSHGPFSGQRREADRGRRCRRPARSRRPRALPTVRAARRSPARGASVPIAAAAGSIGSPERRATPMRNRSTGAARKWPHRRPETAMLVTGIRWMRPPRRSMSRSPVAVSTAPAPKNRTLLNSAWLKTWKSAAVRARARRCGKAVGLESERQAETDENEADVLDGAVGEDPLEVTLHQRVENAEHGGSAADRQDRDAPPPGRRAEEVENDPHEAIDRDFGHDAAHQRGDMARRRRMRERQPDVQAARARPSIRRRCRASPSTRAADSGARLCTRIAEKA